MKIINPRPHGYIDYGAIVLLFLAPSLFAFGGIAQTICYVVAAAYLGMCLLTAYPLGAYGAIPFTVHGGVEAALAVVFAASPWLFGFAEQSAARNFFLVVAVALAGVWLLTNYKAGYDPAHHRTERRSHA